MNHGVAGATWQPAVKSYFLPPLEPTFAAGYQFNVLKRN
jgi:hypothetical protein